MLEKLPESVGHALVNQRAGMEQVAARSAARAPKWRSDTAQAFSMPKQTTRRDSTKRTPSDEERALKDDQEGAVDETDDGPESAPGDIGEGPDSPGRS
jgi:hypothetical protein